MSLSGGNQDRAAVSKLYRQEDGTGRARLCFCFHSLSPRLEEPQARNPGELLAQELGQGQARRADMGEHVMQLTALL